MSKSYSKRKSKENTNQSKTKVENDSIKDLLIQAIEQHRRGVEGDKEAVQRAYELLERARSLEPENLLAEAYYGSTTALIGRDAIDPMERIKKATGGLKILDKVVSKDPKNIDIRILRAYVSYRLPENFFHRTATAVEDFNYLTIRYELDSGLFSDGFYEQLLYDLGMCYKRLERKREAEETWQKLLSKTKNNKYIDLLRQEGF